MWRNDRERAVAELKSVLLASRGNVQRAAANLAISRYQLYRYIRRAKLQGVVAEARTKKDLIDRAKELLE